MKVEVEDAVDRDVLLHLVVPLPVPHDVGLDVVADTPVFSLEGGGQVGGENDTEGENMLTRGQTGPLLDDELLVEIFLGAPVVIRHSMRSRPAVAVSPGHRPLLCPVNFPPPNYLQLDLPEVLLGAQVDDDPAPQFLPGEEDLERFLKLDIEVSQPHL